MSATRPYFEEKQSLRQTQWIWFVVVVVIMSTLGPIFPMVYTQLIEGVPVGNQPMSDTGLIIFSIVMVATAAITTWMLLSLTLETYVDAEGIHYRLFPFKPKWKLVRKESIHRYEFRSKRGFLDGKAGYHKNIFNKTTSLRIRGGRHVRLLIDGDWKVLIGTQNPEEFERAMRRVMTKEQFV